MPNLTGMQQGSAAAVQTALTKDAPSRRDSAVKSRDESPRKSSGYGLPCAKCHLYYPADLAFCPTCHHTERVSAVVPKIHPKPAQAESEEIPDTAVLEREREEFLERLDKIRRAERKPEV